MLAALALAGCQPATAPHAERPPLELAPGGVPGMQAAITALRAHPERPRWLLALGPHRVAYVSRSRGRSWQPVYVQDPRPGRPLPLPDPVAGWLPSGHLVAATAGALHVSSDGGLTFRRHPTELGPAELRRVGEGLWLHRHLPGGSAWWAVAVDDLGEPELVAQPTSPRPPDGPGRARQELPADWALREGVPAFRPPGTARWEPRTGGLYPLIGDLQQDPERPDHVAVIEASGTLWTSTDFGGSWSRQPAEGVDEARPLAAGAWLVRGEGFSLAVVEHGEVRDVSPPPARLTTLNVPPYLEHASAREHQLDMLRRRARHPSLEAAGRGPDDALWVHWVGIDALRDRWVYDGETWRSEERPAGTRAVQAWGATPDRACRTGLDRGQASLGGEPLPAPAALGEALAMGFADAHELVVVREWGVQAWQVDEACTAQRAIERGEWRDQEAPLVQAVVRARPGHPLQILGASRTGLWRLRLPLEEAS